MNKQISENSQHTLNNEVADVSADNFAAPAKQMSPELRALTDHAANRYKAPNRRDGVKAQAHKKEMREEYAAAIMLSEGRAVRDYNKHATEEDRIKARRAQKAASKKRRSPAQIEKERDANTAAKAAKRDLGNEAKQAEAERIKQALKDRAIF